MHPSGNHPGFRSEQTTTITARARTVASAAFVLMVLASVIFSAYKLKALSFHARDFPYYAQFYAKLFDPQLSARYSLNPNGQNFLQFVGTEGQKGLHHSIHFEPLKYLLAALAALAPTPHVLFLILSMLYFAPILYVVWVGRVSDRYDAFFLLLFAAAYGLYPSVFFTVSYDLRPYTVLAPFFVLSFLSIHYRRPVLERTVLFNLMFFAREEALILGLVNILYAAATNYQQGTKPYANLMSLMLSWLAWCVLTLSYFAWTGYENRSAELLASLGTDYAVLAFLGMALLVVTYLFMRRRDVFVRHLPLFAYCLVFVPLGWQFNQFQSKQVFVTPRWILLAVCLLLVFVILWHTHREHKARRIILSTLAIIALVSATLHVIPPHSSLAAFQAYREKANHAAMVFSVRERTNKYTSYVLCDYQTYQAFYDYENVFVYNRLPWYMIPRGWHRYYPLNVQPLRDLLEETIEFVVISNDELDTVMHIIAGTRIKDHLYLVGRNRRYSTYRVLRGDRREARPTR